MTVEFYSQPLDTWYVQQFEAIIKIFEVSQSLCSKVLAWEALGDLIGKDWKTLPVQFDNISFQRAVVLDFNSTTTL